MVGEWQPSMYLQWTADGLQQKWFRDCAEWRDVGGMRDRRYSWVEYEWRLVPTAQPVASTPETKSPARFCCFEDCDQEPTEDSEYCAGHLAQEIRETGHHPNCGVYEGRQQGPCNCKSETAADECMAKVRQHCDWRCKCGWINSGSKANCGSCEAARPTTEKGERHE